MAGGPHSSLGVERIVFIGPGNQQVYATFHDSARTSGTSLDGVYSTTVTVPALAARGTWVIHDASFVDNVGNRVFLLQQNLIDRGLPNSFEQVGAGDVVPPEIQSLSFDRASIDTSAGGQTITLTARLTDDYSGVTDAYVQFFNAVGQVQVAPFYPTGRQSGTALDGVYVGTLTMPRYSAPGTWYVDSVTVHDAAGNAGSQVRSQLAARGLSWSFEQVGQGDTTAPVVQALSWTPTAINSASAAQQITVTARVTDDLSGLSGYPSAPMIVAFVSPSGQYLSTYATRVSGTDVDGIYSGVLSVPALSESGVWTASVEVWDVVRNLHNYVRDDLAAAGLPTTFTNT